MNLARFVVRDFRLSHGLTANLQSGLTLHGEKDLILDNSEVKSLVAHSVFHPAELQPLILGISTSPCCSTIAGNL